MNDWKREAEQYREIDKAAREGAERAIEAEASLRSENTRTCTCHPDDNPPVPCLRKFALDECCKTAALYWSARPSVPSAEAGTGLLDLVKKP